MTRAEFDQRYAARADNTEGFTSAQLARLNDLAFERIADLDIDDSVIKSAVDHALERAARHFDVAES